MPPTTKKLIKRLKAWCDKKRGRRTELGKALGVSPQVVTNWFAERQNPTGDQTLRILEFLKKKK
jgi:hypothetical protein